MNIILTGQVAYISDVKPFNKAGDTKQQVVITSKNAEFKNRLEFLPIDFFGESTQMIDDINLQVGDSIQVTVVLCGRKFNPDKTREPLFFFNIQGISISLL